MKEQVDVLAETHHAEVGRLNKELERTKKECRDVAVARKASEDEARRLQAALNDAAYTNVSLARREVLVGEEKKL